jgi:hypothetical protein
MDIVRVYSVGKIYSNLPMKTFYTEHGCTSNDRIKGLFYYARRLCAHHLKCVDVSHAPVVFLYLISQIPNYL